MIATPKFQSGGISNTSHEKLMPGDGALRKGRNTHIPVRCPGAQAQPAFISHPTPSPMVSNSRVEAKSWRLEAWYNTAAVRSMAASVLIHLLLASLTPTLAPLVSNKAVPGVTAVSLTLITLPINNLNHRQREVCTRTLFLEQRWLRSGAGSTPALATAPPPPAMVSCELSQPPARNVLLQPGPSRGQQ